MGPNDLATDDPDIIRLMNSARSKYRRSEWYEAARVDPYVDSIVSEMSTSVHDARRAKMAAAYSGKENLTLEADIDSQILAFIALIRNKYISSGETVKPVDFARKIQYFTLDVITKVAYGETFDFLGKDEDVHNYIQTTETLVPVLAIFATVPFANAILNRSWIKDMFGPKPTDKSGLGKLMGYVYICISLWYGNCRQAR